MRSPGLSRIAVALVLAVVLPPGHAADAAAGKAKSAPCGACHGAQGIAVAPDAPNLAGQPEMYLAEQLKAYRSGKRKHEVMSLMLSAPASDSPMRCRSLYSSGRSPSLTQRNTRFCSTVARTVSRVYLRAICASA